jgi:hypothetical protein
VNSNLLILNQRIREETSELIAVVSRAERAIRVARKGGEDADLYADAAALNLHDFYTGLERIFRQIAVTVDRSTPAGQEWHRDLLKQMCLDIPGIRPAVLSPETCAALDEFMRFRHVVRNVYAFQLDGKRVAQLVQEAQALMKRIAAELEGFAAFLERAGRG